MSDTFTHISDTVFICCLGSRHSSYTSHASRMSYTSHGDLLGGIGGNGKMMTKESQLRSRTLRNGPATVNNIMEYPTNKQTRGDYVSYVIYVIQKLLKE